MTFEQEAIKAASEFAYFKMKNKEPKMTIPSNSFLDGARWALKYFRKHYNFSYEAKPLVKLPEQKA